ncbi:MAG TPA: PhoH family protein, partial [Candidatus Hydrogenedentes bacterium]|nr:PhoH family protein [Candidatus Hydrogenedentota bacterium]
RLGTGSRAVVTGDITQVDLPRGVESGLGHAMGVLEGVPGIGVVRLTGRDVVRHPLVQRIIDAYETGPRSGNGGRPEQNPDGTATDGP